MQELITVKMTREDYSQLIKSQTDLDFLQSDYAYLNKRYEDMCDRYFELRKDFRKAIESCETQSETIKVMERTIDMLRKGVIGIERNSDISN
ncbi:chordopoxvirus fusion protein [Staphylococcus epidermidis]|uniref:chordopoxvirus fusion protein n=1 Tax=Staphylococcus epidermidis TaxID=1282 RepID=UPI0020966D86|nr:chordopoxvirus fusion protein [Staphylococcus epidermidis]MCG1374804.1 chordopoxvirus fusion protein [Staphylococcus epidermidis]MCO6297630.1 chordopoxvirus fusion protein [Staphylococcus epidermidis]